MQGYVMDFETFVVTDSRITTDVTIGSSGEKLKTWVCYLVLKTTFYGLPFNSCHNVAWLIYPKAE